MTDLGCADLYIHFEIDTSRSSCRVYFTQYFQMFCKNLGFWKIYGANREPKAKKLRKIFVYRAAIKLWFPLVTL